MRVRENATFVPHSRISACVIDQGPQIDIRALIGNKLSSDTPGLLKTAGF